MHIVVVDPSRVVLKIITQLLAAEGTVSGFVDSDAALRFIQNDQTVDVLITSLEVQPVNGLELCWEARQARTSDRFLYVIVMSSLRDEQKLAEALDCGADDLIAKPLKGIELQARLRLVRRLEAKQLELVRLSETDPLSGLFNRRAFFAGAAKLFERRHVGDQLSAIMLDIDHFKRVNDHYGHDVGDAVIKAVAANASTVAGLVGRLGGEEFAIILNGFDARGACELAEQLRQSCANLEFRGPGGETFFITCSLGVSQAAASDCCDDMLKNADVALYQAKNGGRNCVKMAPVSDGALLALPSEHFRSRQR
jgi:two-component system cell cycle response regulator